MGDSVDALMQRAVAAAKAGRRDEAQQSFTQVLRREPDNVTALLWMAWLSDVPSVARTYAERATDCDPGNPQARAALEHVNRRAWEAAAPERTSPAAYWRRLAAAVIVCGLLVCAGAALAWWLPAQGTAEAAPAPTATLTPSPTATATVTPTPIPTWTPTLTPSPTGTPEPTSTPTDTPTPAPPTPWAVPPIISPADMPDGLKWIDVDLTTQTLTAYEGPDVVRLSLVSTGLPDTPTPFGVFYIRIKLRYDDMEGPDYYLPNVPYVMYFYSGYALHGTYWHGNFGHPMSHGCINIPNLHAAWLYEWADLGTMVVIHY